MTLRQEQSVFDLTRLGRVVVRVLDTTPFTDTGSKLQEKDNQV